MGDGGCNYSPTKSKVPDWVATMFANVMPIKNAKHWINFTVPVDTRLTTRVLKVNLGSYKKALCDHALSLMAMKAVDLNGYNQAKVSDFRLTIIKWKLGRRMFILIKNI